MTLFEIHLGRHMKPCEAVEERNFYANLYLSTETLKWRKKTEEQTKQKVKPQQLKLEL